MGWGRTKTAQVANAFDVAAEALRWVADAAVSTGEGATWPLTRAPGAPGFDDLYDGTAGVLVAFAEARLSGLTDFDPVASAAAGRLRYFAGAAADVQAAELSRTGPAAPDLSLYTGLSGIAWALGIWAGLVQDRASRQAADDLVASIAALAAAGPGRGSRDLLEGDAGVLLVLAGGAGAEQLPAAGELAGRLVADAVWPDGQPDWPAGREDDHDPASGEPACTPNFSHGAAGIAYALAAASVPLRRPDLLAVAAAAGRRLVRLGARPDGANWTLAVPYRIPPAPGEPRFSYGWCHGPTGSVRLFQLLDRLQPGEGWDEAVAAALRAIRASGLPVRLYPGFWDNLGQCCGTAGVGELALDRYQDTGDGSWLSFAIELAGDVLDRRIADAAGVRWSHTEHRAQPPELEPSIGWMQGAAGIAGWLLRLARVEREGPGATRLRWPDRPEIHDNGTI